MERRSFLKGLLVSVTAETALVKLANVREISALHTGHDVLLHQPPSGTPAPNDLVQAFMHDPRVYLRSAEGRFLPLGFITELMPERHPVDVSSYDDQNIVMSPGLLTYTGRFHGPIR